MSIRFFPGTLFVTGFITGSLAFSTASAQSLLANEASQAKGLPPSLQESLKDIPAAGMACLNENYVSTPKATTPRAVKGPDFSCVITLEQLSRSSGQSDIVLIDTRPKAEFDKSHIESAVNFTAAELRTKRYLLNKSLILIGDGKTDHDLFEVCGELKDAGFKQSKVLRGGMLSWMADSRSVVGTASHITDFSRLNAGELYRQSKLADNFIVSLSSMHVLADVLPTAINAPTDDLETLRGLIRSRKKTKRQQNVVLIADERFDMNLLTELIKSARPDPLLFYSGSETAYRQFLRVQNAMWAKHAKGPNRPSCGAM